MQDKQNPSTESGTDRRSFLKLAAMATATAVATGQSSEALGALAKTENDVTWDKAP